MQKGCGRGAARLLEEIVTNPRKSTANSESRRKPMKSVEMNEKSTKVDEMNETLSFNIV